MRSEVERDVEMPFLELPCVTLLQLDTATFQRTAKGRDVYGTLRCFSHKPCDSVRQVFTSDGLTCTEPVVAYAPKRNRQRSRRLHTSPAVSDSQLVRMMIGAIAREHGSSYVCRTC